MSLSRDFIEYSICMSLLTSEVSFSTLMAMSFFMFRWSSLRSFWSILKSNYTYMCECSCVTYGFTDILRDVIYWCLNSGTATNQTIQPFLLKLIHNIYIYISPTAMAFTLLVSLVCRSLSILFAASNVVRCSVSLASILSRTSSWSLELSLVICSAILCTHHCI